MSALPGARGSSRRPTKPRRALFGPLLLLAGALFTLWCAAPRPIGIGFDLGQVINSILWPAARPGVELTLPKIMGEMLHPNWAYFPQTIRPLIETIQIAIVACVIGCAVALPLAFLASRVTAPSGWALWLDRSVLNVIRALPDLLYALVFVAAVGVGPLAGVLALTLFNIGVVAKLLSETVDAVDTGPVEAAWAVGATRTQMVRRGVLPQVMPHYVAFALYTFELNVRASTVIGLVGGGGIGTILNTNLKTFNFQNVSLIVLELFVLVLLIELVSVSLRRRLV